MQYEMKTLIDKVIKEIEHDVSTGDVTAIEELIKSVPAKKLEAFLSSCRYCGDNCPNDHEHMCDGYSGDIDNLYEETYNAL